ncbi:MAG: TRAP transporter large permease subunit, partial [Desulfovibrionales bacterium]|nr:TRAP transporter large permease subunit [Desulfovibrionales bacterium]
ILAMTSAVGMMTPPLGVNLFVACNITGLSLEKVSMRAIPFILFMLFGAAVVTLVPQLSLFLLGR